jgi:hypothetical protein
VRSLKENESKNNQTAEQKHILAATDIEKQYPSNRWTHVYTGGSATNAVENVGG